MTSMSAFPTLLAERPDCKYYHKAKEEYVLLAAKIQRVPLQRRLAARTITNSGIGVTRRSVLLELLGRLGVLVFIPERFSHLFRCSGNC